MTVANKSGREPVWDIPVRLFHWSLVATVATAAATGFLFPANWLTVHVVGGGVAGALILARIVWGFTGSTYARFSNFTLSPVAVINHLKEIGRGEVHREGGHNPLGSWMVVTLMAVLLGLVGRGFAVLGGMFKQGPGKSFFSFATGSLVREPHELLAWILLLLVAGHLAGVIFESVRSRENLARALVTGRKAAGFIPARRQFRSNGIVALAAVLLGGAALLWGGFSASALPPSGVPQMTADATWQKECGDCHVPFHPTLLPAQSWEMVMDTLDDHFGEDASLPQDKVAAIKAFLVANAAETSDTLAANRFRKVSTDHPLEITGTPFWTWHHRDIADAVFTSSAVKARQNCAACHADAATGTFAPQSISIPQELPK